MNAFRRIRFGDPDPIHFSPTELCKCPKSLLGKKEGVETIYAPETLQIFEDGSTIHLKEGILRNGMKGLIDMELHMTIIRDDESYIISGYSDFLMFDMIGMYIEDLKSCKFGAFWHFLKEKGSPSELLQVSIYAWLYWIINKVRITKGVITKISRENPRNQISLEIDLIPVEQITEFIEEHPTILFLQDKITKTEFNNRTKQYVENNRWMCNYCDDLKCSIRTKLLKEDDKKCQQNLNSVSYTHLTLPTILLV